MTYQPTKEQEQALREWLQEAIVPLIEQVLVKKLGQAMSFAAKEVVKPKNSPDELQKEYERGFVDGMQKQMQSSVDKAVNAMSRKWVNLSDEEMHACWDSPLTPYGMEQCRLIEARLKERNYD